MAKSITKRTLVGFKDISLNATYFDDLNNMMKINLNNLSIELQDIATGKWKGG